MTEDVERVELAAGQLPCAVCGVAVPRPGKAQVRVARASDQLGRYVTNHGEEFAAEGCGRCDELRVYAGRIVTAHPRAEARFGRQAVDRVVDLLLARRLLGMSELAVDVRDVDLGRQIRVLAPAGAALRFDQAWRARPRWWSNHAAVAPFGHCSQDDLGWLRSARAELAAEELAATAPALQVVPPSLSGARPRRDVIVVDSGCLWCGVGVQEVSAEWVHRRRVADRLRPDEVRSTPRNWERFAKWDRKYAEAVPVPAPVKARGPLSDVEYAARLVWHRHDIRRRQLGAGGGGVVSVEGFLCEACHASTEFGATRGALEKAIYAVCGLKPVEGRQLRGVRGWAAGVVDAVRAGREAPKSLGEPWAHLGGPAELREAIEDALRLVKAKERGRERDLAREAVAEWKASTGVDVNVGAVD